MSAGESPITYRGMRLADVPAAYAIFCRAEGSLVREHGFPWVDPPFEGWSRTPAHLLATDPGHCFVAEDAGSLVGFTAALERDDLWFFAALFISPAYQGRGIGRRLFELAAADAPRHRVTITDSIQPISTALYGRYGLLPATPVVGFAGEPTVREPPDLQPAAPTPPALEMLDRSAYGCSRAPDHPYWASRGTGTLWLRNGQPVAYAYVRADGRLGPLAGRDPESAAAALRAELARLPSVQLVVPGSARRLVEAALGAGLRIDPPPGLLLLSEDAPAPANLVLSSYFLY